jgi:hypothetical protein
MLMPPTFIRGGKLLPSRSLRIGLLVDLTRLRVIPPREAKQAYRHGALRMSAAADFVKKVEVPRD